MELEMKVADFSLLDRTELKRRFPALIGFIGQADEVTISDAQDTLRRVLNMKPTIAWAGNRWVQVGAFGLGELTQFTLKERLGNFGLVGLSLVEVDRSLPLRVVLWAFEGVQARGEKHPMRFRLTIVAVDPAAVSAEWEATKRWRRRREAEREGSNAASPNSK